MLTLAILQAIKTKPNQTATDLTARVEEVLKSRSPGRPVIAAAFHELWALSLVSRWEFMYNLTDSGRRELEDLSSMYATILEMSQ